MFAIIGKQCYAKKKKKGGGIVCRYYAYLHLYICIQLTKISKKNFQKILCAIFFPSPMYVTHYMHRLSLLKEKNEICMIENNMKQEYLQ